MAAGNIIHCPIGVTSTMNINKMFQMCLIFDAMMLELDAMKISCSAYSTDTNKCDDFQVSPISDSKMTELDVVGFSEKKIRFVAFDVCYFHLLVASEQILYEKRANIFGGRKLIFMSNFWCRKSIFRVSKDFDSKCTTYFNGCLYWAAFGGGTNLDGSVKNPVPRRPPAK